jgi:hypothetical protein
MTSRALKREPVSILPLPDRHVQDFSQMQGAPIRHLGDLFAAAKAIGNDQCLLIGSYSL